MIPQIGITTVNFKRPNGNGVTHVINDTYVDAIIKTGGLPALIPVTDDETLLDAYVEKMDGFLFSGGVDISPSFYGENPHRLLSDTSLVLDRCQIPLMRKVIAARKPFLAICRGHQVLNVACGGTLYQDVTLCGDVMKHFQATDSGDYSHLVHIEKESRIHEMFGDTAWTNSFHHQSVKELGRGLVITAHAEDGIVEGVELADYPYGLGVQWHPEAMFAVEDSMRPLFAGLIEACQKES